MKRVTLVVVAAILLASCGSSSALIGVTRLPSMDLGGLTLAEVHSAGITTQLPLRATGDGLLVLYFGYTRCPDLCPTTLSDLHDARDQLGTKGSRVSIAFATVDRVNDTPEVLLTYVSHFGFGINDHALRPVDDVELTRAESAVFATSSATDSTQSGPKVSPNVGHTAWAYVIDTRGHIIDEWPYGTTAKDMAHDLSTLLNRKAE